MENISTFALSFIIVMLLTVAFIVIADIKDQSNKSKASREKEQQKTENNKTTEFFKNIPTSKKSQQFGDMVIKSSQELKKIIVKHNGVDYTKVQIEALEYALFMYDLEFYRQVMTLKYSKSYIEIAIRTIFATLAANNKKAGYNLSSDFLWAKLVSLSKILNDICSFALENDEDEFLLVAMFVLTNECQAAWDQVDNEYALLYEVSEHFKEIINLPIEQI